MAAKWKRPKPDRLERLARAIEAIDERDRRALEDSADVERLRLRGAVELYAACREFVDALNDRLSTPVVLLDPAGFSEASFAAEGINLFQINLRGRLLQIEFAATAETRSTEEFPKEYVLHGAIRSFNQDLLDHSIVNERSIFYCPEREPRWYYLDRRSYRTGRLTGDFLVGELERLI